MMHGPAALFASWALHDVEKVLTFPATADHLAEVTGIEALRMNTKQSVVAVGLVGAVVAWAGARGGGGRPVTHASTGMRSQVSRVMCSLICCRLCCCEGIRPA